MYLYLLTRWTPEGFSPMALLMTDWSKQAASLWSFHRVHVLISVVVTEKCREFRRAQITGDWGCCDWLSAWLICSPCTKSITLLFIHRHGKGPSASPWWFSTQQTSSLLAFWEATCRRRPTAPPPPTPSLPSSWEAGLSGHRPHFGNVLIPIRYFILYTSDSRLVLK